MNVYDLLKQRGFIARTTDGSQEKYQVSDEDAVRKLLGEGTTIYDGFDPSADSLHLGHFMGVMALHHMQEAKNRVIFLLGGATGRIGDPSGKKSSRVLLTEEKVEENGRCIKRQVQRMGLLSFDDPKKAIMVNNADWITKMSFLDDYMMDVARYFSVNEMVKMETFDRRLKVGEGLSLLEFLYTTVQSWDFLILYDKYGCKIQVGGSDQWGNIIQGVNLIKAHYGNKACAQAVTFSLLTTPSGEKMGKTEKGPLWLDPNKTSPFDFYQYIEKIDDRMVRTLFGIYTFLPMEQINEIMSGDPREAQKTLAYEVTKVVHGEEEAKKAQKQSKSVFMGNKNEDLSSIPEFDIVKKMPLDEILVESGSLPSKSEVSRRVKGGAVKINEGKVTDPKEEIDQSCLIKFGKSNFLRINRK